MLHGLAVAVAVVRLQVSGASADVTGELLYTISSPSIKRHRVCAPYTAA